MNIMLHNRKIHGFLAGLTILLIIGCYQDRSIISDTGDEITRTVSFGNDIIPMLNSSCNGSGCHNSGGKAPELTAEKAYSSLTNGYVNTEQPEASELFLWMTGKRGSPMPLSGTNKEYNALVLAWIKQGALNN